MTAFGVGSPRLPTSARRRAEAGGDHLDQRVHGHESTGGGRPFSGVTVLTLSKPGNRRFGVDPDDEQLHVLPHYAADETDECRQMDVLTKSAGHRPSRNGFNPEKADAAAACCLTWRGRRLQRRRPLRVDRQTRRRFADGDMGGLAIALTHGSVLFECAQARAARDHGPEEAQQDEADEDRDGSFYQHKSLNPPPARSGGEERRRAKANLERDYLAYLRGPVRAHGQEAERHEGGRVPVPRGGSDGALASQVSRTRRSSSLT
ncbi:unnamed protein product [Sphagnum tenellum]